MYSCHPSLRFRASPFTGGSPSIIFSGYPSRFRASPSPPSITVSFSLASSATIPVDPLKSQQPHTSSSISSDPPPHLLSNGTRLDSTVVSEQDEGPEEEGEEEEGKKKDDDDDDGTISGVHVPRQKYIPIPKADLLDGLFSLFSSDEDVAEFLRFSKCLDSVLHAEHKDILEEMRIYYSLTDSQEKMGSTVSSDRSGDMTTTEEKLPLDSLLGIRRIGINGKKMDKYDNVLDLYSGMDLGFLFGSPLGGASTNSAGESRVAVAKHFQRAFMKLLRDAQFEELSAQDLLLTYALKTDYLLTLPIYVDWKKASESNAIIFRRGYATERQKGFLIVEKLDYLQSKLLQEIFFKFSRPLKKIGTWVNKALKNSNRTQEFQIWIEKAIICLKEQSLPQSSYSLVEGTSNDQVESSQMADDDLPIWVAAQRAVPRYEGFLSSVGPRGRLIRKLLTWIGLVPSVPETSLDLDNGSEHSEIYMRPNFLPRITLTDIWKPATRESCGNNIWKMFKTGVSILFSRSILQEPAFQELILLYTEEVDRGMSEEKAELLPLKLKIYEKITFPDLPVIFPHKKLSFRILDTVRLDVASILGLLAFFVNYKFENILSSPSAILLDVIAISALILYVSRVVLGYKQTWDRYQLLVNRTLYEKTLASGFGSVYFLLDASEQQQYKEAILAYAHLLCATNYQMSCRRSIGDACERFMYDKFQEKIEMPIDKAVNTLMRLGLVREVLIEGEFKLEALPCLEASEVLKCRWDNLLRQDS